MTRNEAIKHWKLVARTVFQAESNIIEQWGERLKMAKENPDTAEKTLDGFLTAVAEEILKATTDDELTYMEW